MAVREYWEIKWIEWINVQQDWVTQVSLTDTFNFVWGWTVTDTGWVATINIPQWVTWYREDVTAWSATYTFQHSPATTTSFLVFTDSWTLMFLGVDYTYDPDTETITFLSLGNSEAAYIWVAHAIVQWWGIGDMVKSVYDPTNINSSAFQMDNFIDGTNKHYISTAEKTSISTALQPNDNISNLYNDTWYITSVDLPTKTSDLQNDSWFITAANIPTKTSQLNNDSWFITSSSVPTKTSELQNDSWFVTNQVSNWAYDSTWDWDNTTAPSKNAVYDKMETVVSSVSWKQDTLVSWTNIKTINNTSLLWSGNISITWAWWDVVWPSNSTDSHIAVFDWATGKLLKDSWLTIQVTNSVPTWASICDVYYNGWTIYLYTWAVRNNITLE